MVCFPGLGPSDIHDIPIWSMLWCDRLYSQKGKKLIVRTCYYLSFILKYKNSNSQCNNVTSGGRFCKLIFNSYQKFLCSKPDALLFCVHDLCRRQTAYHIPEMTDIAHVWHCEAPINVKKIKVWRRDSCEFLLKKRRIHYFWSLVPHDHLRCQY